MSERSAVQSSNQSTIKRFVNDDEGYFGWLERNQKGFVVNCRYTPSPDYLVLHRSKCPHIQRCEGQPSTNGDQCKVCAERLEEVHGFAKKIGGTGGALFPCRDCNPLATIPTEKLAYWFFRLNGCLTIENFVVHPDFGTNQCTDADILGVRFPHRAELNDPMEDHPIFKQAGGHRPLLFIAEVKGKTCRLNGPWTNPPDENIQRVLRAIGALPLGDIDTVAAALYAVRKYDSPETTCPGYAVRLIALADMVSSPMQEQSFEDQYENAIPITWTEVLRFIYRRFRKYPQQKSSHGQWDKTGQQLWDMAERYKNNEAAFIQSVRYLLVDSNDNKKMVADESEIERSKVALELVQEGVT